MPSPVGGGQRSMAPSPMSTANTPLMNEGGPSSQEDAQYLEKVRQLSKYIEPLRQMIARIGDEDQNRLDKMKKLMDILSNPNKRMHMDTLIKCEVVLARMNFDIDGSSSTSTAPATTTSSETSANPLLDAVANLKKSQPTTQLNHTMQQMFGSPLEAIYGSDISLPSLPKRRRRWSSTSDESSLSASPSPIPDVLQGEVARLRPIFKVTVDPVQPHLQARRQREQQPIHLICELDDANLPSVPPLSLIVPASYPMVPPVCDDIEIDDPYSATPFLCRVRQALSSRLDKMPHTFTLSQLMSAWEMSVRSACSPNYDIPVTPATVLLGL